jgi:hypothetical protein
VPDALSAALSIAAQVDRLVAVGVPAAAGLTEVAFRERAAVLPEVPGAVVVVHPRLAPASTLAPLLSRDGKPGFVVVDMTDLDDFTDVKGVEVPDADLYLLAEVDRGDDLRSWSPDEVYPELEARGRTPLTVNEGISWLLTHPEQLVPNHCFMTIGSRKVKNAAGALDTRTPALWISGGTGRDPKGSRGAPKVGWCWAGNRHTWLGFASATSRSAGVSSP